jgi:hypothetical protein
MNEEVEVTPTIQHPVLVAQNERIETLMKANEELAGELAAYKNKDEYVSAQLTKWSDKYRSAEYALTDLLKELITDEEITLENAQRIADIFDNVTLTKRVSIRYEIVATVELEVPFGKEDDEIADNTFCDRVTFETYESDCEVLEVDFDVTDWNVTS